ncbi:hypothetical protein [Scytonema sp. PRP1]
MENEADEGQWGLGIGDWVYISPLDTLRERKIMEVGWAVIRKT